MYHFITRAIDEQNDTKNDYKGVLLVRFLSSFMLDHVSIAKVEDLCGPSYRTNTKLNFHIELVSRDWRGKSLRYYISCMYSLRVIMFGYIVA